MAPTRAIVPSADFFEAAAGFIRQHTGLVFGDSRRAALEAALVKAMRLARVTDPELYLARLGSEPSLLDELVAEITVGETYFFRDPQQFVVIRDRLLPELLRGRSASTPVRVWSAGCASGEEPYTLAILASELGVGDTVRILGTDLSRPALGRARLARYTRWSLRGVPAETVERYFEPAGDQFVLRPDIRNVVEFGYLNLAVDAYPSLRSGVWGMDLILCRNVLIYLDTETIALVARHLLATLTRDGWLVLGASDPPLADVVPCEVVITDTGLAYRRPRSGRKDHPGGEVSRPPPPVESPPPVGPPPSVEPQPPIEPERPFVEPRPAALEPVARRAADPRLTMEGALQAYARWDYDRAGELAGRVAAQPDSTVHAWVLLVRSAGNRGDLVTAGRACIAGLERHPECVELTYLQGLLLAEGGHLSAAENAFRRALYLDR
ncbi:MAG: protein-glutamate O-methyltransferase CheR, partial [Gemmatimonadetes bacterium]|nr:protein-glutamate O-methyltransferase CheR [Gemmatimonadota bacterium]